jgi:hypothetical protein
MQKEKEISTNCYWTGYLLMGYIVTIERIHCLFKVGEQYFLAVRAG